jgi:hypothetical protein
MSDTLENTSAADRRRAADTQSALMSLADTKSLTDEAAKAFRARQKEDVKKVAGILGKLSGRRCTVQDGAHLVDDIRDLLRRTGLELRFESQPCNLFVRAAQRQVHATFNVLSMGRPRVSLYAGIAFPQLKAAIPESRRS